MAIIQANFMSLSLMRVVPIQVILPVDKRSTKVLAHPPAKEFKTLYLLHGLLGNYTDWVVNTNIQRYAEEYELAVVMPSGDNSFYVDGVLPHQNYGKLIGKELVEMTRKMFPLSCKREDTFIGGLSMGGFGALRNGFKYARTFSHIAALSSAVHMFEDPGNDILHEDAVFGDLKEAAESDKNPRVALKNLKEALKRDTSLTVPKVYMSVGTEDGLLKVNRKFRDFLVEEGVDLTYEEAPGMHNWEFWDAQIKKVLDWLPLNEAGPGFGSGNVTAIE